MFTFERSSKQVNGKDEERLVSNFRLEVSLNNPYTPMIIGEARTKTVQQIWRGNDSTRISFDLTMDNYSISQIEKIRNGSNLCLHFLFLFQASAVGQSSKDKDIL